MLSFVIPAHNEETLLAETLRVLKASADELRAPYEIIVADDASTDRTAEIARAAGASVQHVERRQIAAARNAGATVATGETLIFVDADTLVSATTLRQALDAIRAGAVACGAPIRIEPDAAEWAHLVVSVTALTMRAASLAAGSFIAVRRDVFDRIGGFDERYFALEELVLSRAVKQHGRLVIVREPVLTSGRKMRFHGPGQLLKISWALISRGRKSVQQREGLDLWYDGKR